jgi:hypothetical protein
LVAALYMERCDMRWEEQWTVEGGSAWPVSPLPPSRWGTPSLYCFAVTRREGYEPDLVKEQLRRGVGIFACDEYSVFSDGEPMHLGNSTSGEVWTFAIPKLKIDEKKGQYNENGSTTDSWINTQTFMQVWQSVKAHRAGE